jgi:hypothetical protein
MAGFKEGIEEEILVKTAKIIVRRLQKEDGKEVFSTKDFICKLTNEEYCPSLPGNYNGLVGKFLSKHRDELCLSKEEDKNSPASPALWRISPEDYPKDGD